MSIVFSAWDIGIRMHSRLIAKNELPPQKPAFLQEIHNGLEKAYTYRIIPPKVYNLKDEESLRNFQRALVLIQQEYPKEFSEYIERKKSKGESLDSSEKIEGHFIALVSRGCCSGLVNSLFHNIYRGQYGSLAESAHALQYEELYFRQLLECIRPKLPVEEYIFKGVKGDHISKNLLWNAFPQSSGFCANATTLIYRKTLEKLAFQFPGCQNFVGIIKIPNHVFAFQYGPQGYYLYDSFSAHFGLFSFPNEETFFNAIREHSRYDLVSMRLGYLQRIKPNDTEEVRLQQVEELQSEHPVVVLAVRPLDQISPFPC